MGGIGGRDRQGGWEREKRRREGERERDWITKKVHLFSNNTNSPTKRHRFPYFLKLSFGTTDNTVIEIIWL